MVPFDVHPIGTETNDVHCSNERLDKDGQLETEVSTSAVDFEHFSTML
jgi:hypothetical protein